MAACDFTSFPVSHPTHPYPTRFSARRNNIDEVTAAVVGRMTLVKGRCRKPSDNEMSGCVSPPYETTKKPSHTLTHEERNGGICAKRKKIAEETGVFIGDEEEADVKYTEWVEEAIGTVRIPVCIPREPLSIHGEFCKNPSYFPLATTETCFVAGICRGVKACNRSGGVRVRIVHDGMTRAPAFTFPSIEDHGPFKVWLEQHSRELKECAAQTTHHGVLKKITPFEDGSTVYVRLEFSTGDAMGMNMVTIAADEVCHYIEQNYSSAKLISLSSNLCTDKKPSYMNIIEGRGKSVIASAVISQLVIGEIFKTTPESIDSVMRNKWRASAIAGCAPNAQIANVVAAIFAATGQDLGQVGECSNGRTETEISEHGDLKIWVSLTLNLGTVGGGTRLPAQNKYLKMMHVEGSGHPIGAHASRLAEITAAAILVGELNLLAALATRDLASSHAFHARKTPPRLSSSRRPSTG